MRFSELSLTRRFAIATAALAAVSVLVTVLSSWWLIREQQAEALRAVAAQEARDSAELVALTLASIEERMSETADSSIIATALVDSAGRETYLVPFLSGIRRINGVPVDLLFTDFEGKAIADNGGRFSQAELEWLRLRLQSGREGVTLIGGPDGVQVLGVRLLTYWRTDSPEGALLYTFPLASLQPNPRTRLILGPQRDAEPGQASVAVPVPASYREFGLRMLEPVEPAAAPALGAQYLVLLVVAAVMAALVLGLGSRLAWGLTRELRRLESFAKGVVERGFGESRAEESGSPEVASLARSTNHMLDRLHEQHRQLEAERARLQDADRRKDEFLAMLGHELRNPLAPITTSAYILGRLELDEPRVHRLTEIIARQARHMSGLIDDLLDVARITRGLVTLEKVPLELGPALSEAVEQVRPQIQEREHSLHVDLPSEPVWVAADRVRLIQIVSNLLSNAARYTPAGGHIELGCEAGAAEVVLRVRDDGMGIDPALLPQIFELFTQGKRPSDRAQGGLGLGLAVVKGLVELHGGRVEARSEGEGRGSEFLVRLPRLPVSAVPVPAAVEGARPVVQTRRILVVDDNRDAAESLAEALRAAGHAVAVAAQAQGALEQAVQEAPEVLVLDIGLPGMDGYELARRLRRLPGTADALFIALTGYGQEQDRAQARAAGFDYHLLKPVDVEQLLRVVREAERA